MRVTAWQGGLKGYGIRIEKQDRQKFFAPKMKFIEISFCGGPPKKFKLTPSFWRDCLEIRGLEIRDWFQQLKYVKADNLPNRRNWPKSKPPKLVLSKNGQGFFDLVPLRHK